jgi:hypothetical protein
MDVGSDSVFVVLIVLITVGGSLAVILAITLASMRNRRVRLEWLHQERIAAIEKGLPVPMDYSEVPRRSRPYVKGLVFFAIGLGTMIMGAINIEGSSTPHPDTDLIGIGSIFLLVGVALAIGDWISVKREAQLKLQPPLFPEAGTEFRNPTEP